MKKYLIVAITLASTLSAFCMDKESPNGITKQEPVAYSPEKKGIDPDERVVQTYTAEDLEEILDSISEEEEKEEPGSEEDEDAIETPETPRTNTSLANEEFRFDPNNSSVTEDWAESMDINEDK
jgi:hypothetical protein